MTPENFLDIEDAIKNANSLRGALFVLKNQFPEFMGYNIGYEYFVREHSFKRGDVIVQTTLPAEITAQYGPSGGQNADPVIENIAKLSGHYTVDLTKIVNGKSSKYKNKFHLALSKAGITTMTVYAFLPPDSYGYGGITVLEEEAHASLKISAERFAEIGFFFHTMIKRHGHIMRYLGITKSEQDVLRRMADGKTAQDAAQEFDVTPRTIEMRLQSARKKLKARTTTEAVFKSVCYGIL